MHRVVREHIGYIWKVKIDQSISNGVIYPREPLGCGQDVINQIDVEQFSIRKSYLV